jgi:hypothetical protein
MWAEEDASFSMETLNHLSFTTASHPINIAGICRGRTQRIRGPKKKRAMQARPD